MATMRAITSNLVKNIANFLPFFAVRALHRLGSARRKSMQIRAVPSIADPVSHRLLFDVTRVSRINRVTGITRVIVELGAALARILPALGLELIFFRLSKNGRLVEAQAPSLNVDSFSIGGPGEKEISVREGDIFLFPDVTGAPSGPRAREISLLRGVGARVFFLGYDMLPITHQKLFTRLSRAVYVAWTQSVLNSDGVLFISESSRREFWRTLGSKALRRNPNFETHVIQLGSTKPAEAICASLQPRRVEAGPDFSFLMVGTLEPRKGYSEVLDVFDQLWLEGETHTLTIIGGAGWKTERLIERIRNHREFGRRLRWLSEANDQDLSESYRTSDALIANSAAEGFGLPLIEASLSGLPLIVNRIPPFQEIAGDNAFYFESGISESLKSAIRSWCELYRSGSHPDSSGIEVKSWDEVAGTLVKSIIPAR
jgi:glycosyltransferase involved in cell wall biosynthesis